MCIHRQKGSLPKLYIAGGLFVAGLAPLTSGVRPAYSLGLVKSAPVDVQQIQLPREYRDWRLISVAHEEGNLNDLRAVLGNGLAVRALRDRSPIFPDGAKIARLAWAYSSSSENDAAFGRKQSFVAGAPTNIQIMQKDSKRYSATGGWGFAQFADPKAPNTAHSTECTRCHQQVSERDGVFTRYAP